MKLLPICAFALCLHLQPILAMDNHYALQEREDKYCNMVTTGTNTLGACALVNTYLAYNEYKRNGLSERCIYSGINAIAFGGAATITYLTNRCNQ